MEKCEQCIMREFNPLKNLSKEELSTLSKSKSSHHLKKGKTIFVEGENINGVYCIKNGICKLTKLGTKGKDHIIKLSTKGELLGQRYIIGEEPASLSAIALEEMEICFIPKQEIVKLFSKNNPFFVDMMKTVCYSLKSSDDFVINIAQKNVKERLAQVLINLYETFGTNTDKTLKIQLSREELASMICTATESCIRLLSDFNKNEIIELTGKKIILKDIFRLKKLAGK